MDSESGTSILTCSACGARTPHPSDMTKVACDVCGEMAWLRRCPTCGDFVAFGQPSKGRWKHEACGRVALDSRWPPATLGQFSLGDDASLSALYEGMGLDPEQVFSNPNRRRCDGTITEAAGLSGVVSGHCTLFFDDGFVTLCVGDTSQPVAIPYSDVTTLQFGGRGAFQERTGKTFFGGGFGPVGMLTGMAVASVLSAASTKTVDRVETIIRFGWTDGQLTMVNETQTPERMAVLLAPVVQMLRERASTNAPTGAATGSLVGQLRELAELHGAGALSDEEFALAKQRLLTEPGQGA